MKNRKDLLGGFIIIMLLVLVLVTYIVCYDYKKNKDILITKDNSFKINLCTIEII